jgi:hypothetical protein
MTIETLKGILNEDSHLEYYYDNAFQGLEIIKKYFPEQTVIRGATHDVIYSVEVYKLLNAGLTEEDAHELSNMNWMIECDMMACFV